MEDDRIEALEDQVKDILTIVNGFKATSPLWGDIKKGIGLNEQGLKINDRISSIPQLPQGANRGDMLVYDGSRWSLVAAAGTDSVLVFDFSGTGLPIWVTLNLCP